ncbi:MAG: hypothetical protein ACTJHE_08175, partial [Vibrio casei]
MAKSKIARKSEAIKHVRNAQNVIPLNLTVPFKGTSLAKPRQFDVSHLLHLGCNKENEKIDNRAVFIRSFCKKANQYVSNGNSAQTVTACYDNF